MKLFCVTCYIHRITKQNRCHAVVCRKNLWVSCWGWDCIVGSVTRRRSTASFCWITWVLKSVESFKIYLTNCAFCSELSMIIFSEGPSGICQLRYSALQSTSLCWWRGTRVDHSATLRCTRTQHWCRQRYESKELNSNVVSGMHFLK
jgi:hypothetical protein